jgi:diguanylate cyclase (GGDEF)-like protein/PAS domain S-box-containing protein
LNDQLSGEVAHRAAAEAALSESEAHLRAVLDNVAEGILTVDDSGRIQTCNPAAEQVFGLDSSQVVGRRLGDLVPSLAVEPTADAFMRLLIEQKLLGFGAHETFARRRDEGAFPVEIAIVEMRRDHEHRFVVSARDITERQQAAAALEHQALHDALTGLPNRLLLHDRLEQAVLLAQREQTSLALLVMDLDRFKEVNDTLGHYYGDLLLRELGQRLQSTLRAADTVARLGGDEFAVLLPRASSDDAVAAAQRLIEAVERPFAVEGHPVEVGASVGIALFPDHGGEPGVLLRRADVAMYIAKRTQAGFSTYSPEQDQHSPDRLALMAELRTAIEEDQLELWYQPKIDFGTAVISGAEALVRWRHPLRGMVPPDQFIPLAEQSGQVKALSRWVLNRALRQCRDWARAGTPLGVAVNLSMRDLHDPALPETVGVLLKRWQVAPEALTVEITESTLMADPVQALEIVRRLSGMGVSIAIDDFGTGYSSLAYLKRLPVDELKVDRAFVRHIAHDNHDAAIVRSTIGLAHDLGLSVVAEGIEDQASWDVLAQLGCDRGQGYFISKPLPAAELADWVRDSAWGQAAA